MTERKGKISLSEELLAELPEGERTVLLHTCCAPCSSAIVEAMVNAGITPIIYYCNPNIWPQEEYLIRKGECTRYATSLGLEIIDADYDHDTWLSTVKGLENEPERGPRCIECFRLRLRRTAEYAHTHGIKVFATTLASSRWKSIDQINAAGEEAAALYPELWWWGRNWRKGGLQARRCAIIREQNFYNQLYCGCEYSFRTGN